jgi:hypothetical protein
MRILKLNKKEIIFKFSTHFGNAKVIDDTTYQIIQIFNTRSIDKLWNVMPILTGTRCPPRKVGKEI